MILRLVTAAALSLLIAPDAAAPPMHEVTIQAVDYAFIVPSVLAPGTSAFRFVNKGTKRHEVQIFQFKRGVSQDSARRLLAKAIFPEHDVEPWMAIMTARLPGASAERVLLDVKSGELYALRCQFQDNDSAPHHDQLGMFAVMRVR